VELRFGIFDRHDAHIARQDGVERPPDDQGLVRGGHARRRHLAEGVNTGVGPTRAVHDDGCAVQPRQCRLEQTLDGHPLGLPLPADVGGPVVRDGQLEHSFHVVGRSIESEARRARCRLSKQADRTLRHASPWSSWV